MVINIEKLSLSLFCYQAFLPLSCVLLFWKQPAPILLFSGALFLEEQASSWKIEDVHTKKTYSPISKTELFHLLINRHLINYIWIAIAQKYILIKWICKKDLVITSDQTEATCRLHLYSDYWLWWRCEVKDGYNCMSDCTSHMDVSQTTTWKEKMKLAANICAKGALRMWFTVCSVTWESKWWKWNI